MDVKFPYENVGKDKFGPVYRPIAKVTFQSPVTNKLMEIWMIVDTGADYTILPRLFSEKLRVSLERDCYKDVTCGVGGEEVIYFYKKTVKARIGQFERNVPIAFFDGNDVPALLGRLGFLETFDAEFLKSRYVVFKD